MSEPLNLNADSALLRGVRFSLGLRFSDVSIEVQNSENSHRKRRI